MYPSTEPNFSGRGFSNKYFFNFSSVMFRSIRISDRRVLPLPTVSRQTPGAIVSFSGRGVFFRRVKAPPPLAVLNVDSGGRRGGCPPFGRATLSPGRSIAFLYSPAPCEFLYGVRFIYLYLDKSVCTFQRIPYTQLVKCTEYQLMSLIRMTNKLSYILLCIRDFFG